MSEESNTTPARPLDPNGTPPLDLTKGPPPDGTVEQSAAEMSLAPPADPSPEYDPDAPVDLAMDPVDFDIAHAADHNMDTDRHRIFENSPTFLTQLPTSQYLVALLLARGDSISQIAHVHHMSRTTIHRWLRHDARFIAAVNQGRHIHRTEMDIRLSALSGEATDNMANAVKRGDMQASAFVIRHVAKDRPGSLSPRVIAKRIARRKQRIADFVNSPEGASKSARITSTLGKPPALLESADPSSSPSADNVVADEQKGGTPQPTAQAPESVSAPGV